MDDEFYEKEKELIAQSKKGDRKATEKLIQMNEPFIMFIIKNRLRFYDKSLLEDIVSEGRIGLWQAIERHDEEKIKCKASFVSYKRFYIHNRITRFLKKNYKTTSKINFTDENYHCDMESEDVPINDGVKARELMRKVMDANFLTNNEKFTLKRRLEGWMGADIDREFFDNQRISFYFYSEAVKKVKKFAEGRKLPKPSKRANEIRYVIPDKYQDIEKQENWFDET